MGQVGGEAGHAFHNLVFTVPQRGLVGYLEKVTGGFRPFPVKAADGNVELRGRLNDLLHLFGDDEAWQMHHHGGPHARAQVGGTGGNVAQPRIVGVWEPGLQFGVYFGDGPPCFFKLDAGQDILQAQMVFLIKEDAGILAAGDEDGAAFRTRRQFPGNEVAFHQQLFLLLGQSGELRIIASLHDGDLARFSGSELQRFLPLLACGPAGKGGGGQVARQADAGGEDDVVLIP